MLHEPSVSVGKDNAADYKASLGVVMFIVYSIIYTGFVLLNVINPVSMEIEMFFGMNLACVYGFGLIIIALIQALIYDAMCKKQEEALNTTDRGGNE
jgi:uncharacterized membrane protein (DUF485 family)